jgi:hypothetical protein
MIHGKESCHENTEEKICRLLIHASGILLIISKKIKLGNFESVQDMALEAIEKIESGIEVMKEWDK